MKRLGKVQLVPATNIITGRTYIGCLHRYTAFHNRSSVIAIEGEENIDKNDQEQDCFTCRFQNGNTYPYLRSELFKLMFEYQVPSLANARKILGTNLIEFSDTDYQFIVENQIGLIGNDIEAIIDFDLKVAKLITKEITFSLNEVITILENLKMNDGGEMSSLAGYVCNTRIDQQLNEKIKQLKTQYNG